jgi:hypothetical protein
MLLPPDLRDWLDDDHLAWFVIEAIEGLDPVPFYASYRADGHGRAAHDPKMMVTLFAYSKRQCMVEPVFAQIKTNRRIDRLKRRGRAAARSEWRLIAATHNLLKLHRHQLAATTV